MYKKRIIHSCASHINGNKGNLKMQKSQQLMNIKMTYQFMMSELTNKVAKQRLMITFNRIYKSFVENEITYGECVGKIGNRFLTLSVDAFA